MYLYLDPFIFLEKLGQYIHKIMHLILTLLNKNPFSGTVADPGLSRGGHVLPPEI
jgi:hypothetical protein